MGIIGFSAHATNMIIVRRISLKADAGDEQHRNWSDTIKIYRFAMRYSPKLTVAIAVE